MVTKLQLDNNVTPKHFHEFRGMEGCEHYSLSTTTENLEWRGC